MPSRTPAKAKQEDPKVRENRVRRVAARRGYRLEKSRRRDPQAIDYGQYMLVDASANAVILGGSPYPFSASLDEVEDFIDSDGSIEMDKVTFGRTSVIPTLTETIRVLEEAAKLGAGRPSDAALAKVLRKELAGWTKLVAGKATH